MTRISTVLKKLHTFLVRIIEVIYERWYRIRNCLVYVNLYQESKPPFEHGSGSRRQNKCGSGSRT